MADLSGWIQAGVASTVATVGAFFWAGNINGSVSNNAQRIEVVAEAQKADHDKVVEMNQKLSDVSSDVSEIKQNVKELVVRARK